MGVKQWWYKITGNEIDPAKTGVKEPLDAQLDEYESQKADEYMEQRDPGVMGMVNDEFKQDRGDRY